MTLAEFLDALNLIMLQFVDLMSFFVGVITALAFVISSHTRWF